MPIGKVWIYRLLLVCLCFVCVFVRLRIFQPRIKLAASNFAGRFIGVKGREFPILENFALTKAQNRPNRPAREGRWMFQLVTPRRNMGTLGPAMCDVSRLLWLICLSSSGGVWTWDWHVWIYVSPRKRTYLLELFLMTVHISSRMRPSA